MSPNDESSLHERLSALLDNELPEAEARERALSAFYERWREDPLVLDKWFAIQAGSPDPRIRPGRPSPLAKRVRSVGTRLGSRR